MSQNGTSGPNYFFVWLKDWSHWYAKKMCMPYCIAYMLRDNNVDTKFFEKHFSRAFILKKSNITILDLPLLVCTTSFRKFTSRCTSSTAWYILIPSLNTQYFAILWNGMLLTGTKQERKIFRFAIKREAFFLTRGFHAISQ